MDRTQQAFDFITGCCQRIGAFYGTSDVHSYLEETAADMSAAKPSAVFPDRYKEHVAFALNMIALHEFTSPPAAISSVYLATRFEFYFRILSGKLNGDGSWISRGAQAAAKAAIRDERLDRKQISSVALAYKIMTLDQSRRIAQVCAALDKALYPVPKGKIVDVGDRIEFLRHPAGHGQQGDPSAEAPFYGLLTALVFYNQQ